ncbi:MULTISPECIES: NAD(P)/FAD-dependent oxidoreductase [Bradyrhizobium]|jgi:putative flavoprotein involved in K+ transport|uniref:NAD(P)/FAD-dependent oxidoreductase n=1 Tax=Bradyrhizobium TaxID=374 RepID=UPI000480B291|nr:MULTISPECIES: NAD(P)/FAD-dependent oxidoreductase [Bradyrhizobium]MCS3445245.1 putative flavoprotein involved in K+ transport [Bradyrhizobium elkanii]MCS3563624.1 putative flavoprotein involved in K+ transport [Bradyrhizobium elkanii]MCW2146541.1 putative flavoprotein involved in K+ transport [Bradyrhizobium elkanii]MCW2354383.1 putative flavoprotein involved in K+ transport [Bradyrhizobium elkanii]MCW2379371.1 putative flavoprotein involved in K+ transport [Bradyrhizobium elkanii]
MLTKAPDGKITALLDEFNAALSSGDIERAIALFQTDCYWRDLVTFTWNIKTMEGKDQIRDMLKARLADSKPSGWRIADGEAASEAGGIIESWIEFETDVARGYGHLRMKDGRIWTLLTTMAELKGHEEKSGFTRPLGAKHGHGKDRKSWREERDQEITELGHAKQPYALIIGGGQGGIALGARLRQLNVPTIIIEKNERAGDSWRKRYKSLCLHDPVWYDHLPYIDFPKNWPVFAPKDKIGDWLEMYTKVMELNYWSSTAAKSARYDEKAGEWTVVVERDGKEITLKPKQLVLATGMSGKANWPTYKGQDIFKGEQQHSSTHPGPEKYRGKKVVVIGSNNSAHDICAALWEGGADVTMVQRSSTHIVKSDTLMDIGLGALYSEQAVASGVTTRKADLIFASLPYKIMHEFQIPLYEQMRERDKDFYAALEKVGFMHDWGDDGSGLFMKYLRRGSGYYIDVGACDLVIDGSIKLKSGKGAAVRELTETGVRFVDGSELPADLVVYATGYGSMNGWAADLISKDVADKVGKVWGLGSETTKDPGPWEGEQRNMWKPTQQQALWFHGGNLHQSRHYSQYLALQLKARMEGIPTPVYGLQKVHHLG